MGDVLGRLVVESEDLGFDSIVLAGVQQDQSRIKFNLFFVLNSIANPMVDQGHKLRNR